MDNEREGRLIRLTAEMADLALYPLKRTRRDLHRLALKVADLTGEEA